MHPDLPRRERRPPPAGLVMPEPVWHDVGSVAELRGTPLRQIQVGRTAIALSSVGDDFAAVSGVCNHAVPMAETLLAGELSHERIARGGRKASGERGAGVSP